VAQGVGPEFKPQYQKKKALKKKQFEPAPVAHTYNPVYSGIRDQEDEVQSQLPALSK
jgi:predicted carbohydrate-binding protein with CBM5 and CBM33 domain